MKLKEALKTLRNKKILSLVLLVVIALATVLATSAIKSSNANNDPRNLLPSADQIAKTILDKSGNKDSWISGDVKSTSALSTKLSKLPDDLGYSRQNRNSNSHLRRNKDVAAGKYFEKGKEAFLLADNSNEILVLAQNDGGESQGGSTSGGSSKDESWVPPLQHLNPEPDGAIGAGAPGAPSFTARTTSEEKPGDDPKDPSPVPEPVSLLLFGTGLVGMAIVNRKSLLGKR